MASPPRGAVGRHPLERAPPPPSASASIGGGGSAGRQGMHAPTLQSDTVVFQHAKLPSRQAVNAGSAPPPPPPPQQQQQPPSSSQAYGAPRRGSNSPSLYSNAWGPAQGSSMAPPSAASGGYRRYRDDQDERILGGGGGGGRDYGRSDGTRRHPHAHHPFGSGGGGGGSGGGALAPGQRDSPARAAPDTDSSHLAPRRHLEPDSYVRASESDAAFAQAAAAAHNNSSSSSGGGGGGGGSGGRSAESSVPNIARMTVRVVKEGNKLGFGIRHDAHHKLRVSTLQGNSAAAKSSLRLGDILLAVNGVSLRDLGFLEVIQHLKATRPGELVFDIERDLNASPTHAYEYPPTDLDAGEDYIGDPPSSYLPLPPARAVLPPGFAGKDGGGAGAPAPPPPQALAPPQPPPQQAPSRPAHAPPPAPPQASVVAPVAPAPPSMALAKDASAAAAAAGASGARPAPPSMGADAAPRAAPVAAGAANLPTEPQRKRGRPPSSSSDAADVNKMEKTHKQVVNTLVLELKKERAEKASLEDKNNALRKRLQKMLIECDEVRVKASTEVAAARDAAKRQAQQLEQALSAAKAQLRLQDRGPSVARTDSLVGDLAAAKAALERLRRAEAERAAQLDARFSMENRHADREAHRVREKLVALLRAQLRQAAKRQAQPAGGKPEPPTVTVVFEGLRRLAFLKLFGFPHDFEQYTSPEFYSLAQIHRSLEHDELADLFGSALAHEERAGVFTVAVAPMDVAYDPSTERLSLVCGWTEQNQIRELARNFRF